MRPPAPPTAAAMTVADQLDEISRLAADSCKPNAPKLTATATPKGVVINARDPRPSHSDLERELQRLRLLEARVLRSVREVTGCSAEDAWSQIELLPPGVYDLLLIQDKYQRRDTIAHYLGGEP